jgi:hypothetical protein
MGRVVLITLSEYRAIMQWEEDGGKVNADITYEIIADMPRATLCQATMCGEDLHVSAQDSTVEGTVTDLSCTSAQDSTGIVEGTVTDLKGDVVAGATVELIDRKILHQTNQRR